MGLLSSPLLIKRISYLILVAFTANVVVLYVNSSQAYWLLWTALLLSLITTGDSFKRRLIMIVITGFASAFMSFAAGCLVSLPILLALFLFIITAVCIVISQRYPEYFLQALIVNLFVIISGGVEMPLVAYAEIFILMSIGIAIAALLQIIFYPYFIRNELQSYAVISLRHLKKLNKEIFACFLEPEYSDNIYLYERRLHVQKSQFLHALSRLREVIQLVETKLNEKEIAAHELLLSNLELLYENMLDYSQLRRRVTDYATFSLCSQELTKISNEIDKLIEAVIAHVLSKKYYANIQNLNQSINQLDNNYNNVLRIAAREPLVFLLFIDSLNAFGKKLEDLYSHPFPSTTNLS